jgi:hypothetical protein
MGGLSSRRAQTVRAGERLETARAKTEGRLGELEDLESELLAELEAIDGAWTEKAGDVEVVSVPLELSDVSVDEVALVWIPMA